MAMRSLRGEVLIELDDMPKSRSLETRQRCSGQLLGRPGQARSYARRADGQRSHHLSRICRRIAKNTPSVAAMMVGQQKIFDAQRKVMDSEVSIITTRCGRCSGRSSGLAAQKASLSDRAGAAPGDGDFEPLLPRGGAEEPALHSGP